MKKIHLILVAILVLVLSSCDVKFELYDYETPDGIRITYLDVGQGDCEFIEFPDGKNILIDCGESGNGEKIVDFITDRGYYKIDYLIATHPHSDHIGSMEYVVDNMDIGMFCMPDAMHTTNTYKGLLEAVIDNEIQALQLKAGVEITSGENYVVETLAPVDSKYDELNDYSAVVKVTYSGKKFLFCGDAEEVSEFDMMSKNTDLDSDVLKVGHHGSSTSTSDKFLDKVNPDYAIISCGADNSYGHPHKETIAKLDKKGVRYFRTDISGNITVTSNGDYIEVETEN